MLVDLGPAVYADDFEAHYLAAAAEHYRAEAAEVRWGTTGGVGGVVCCSARPVCSVLGWERWDPDTSWTRGFCLACVAS